MYRTVIQFIAYDSAGFINVLAVRKYAFAVGFAVQNRRPSLLISGEQRWGIPVGIVLVVELKTLGSEASVRS